MSINALSMKPVETAQVKTVVQDFHHALMKGNCEELELLVNDVVALKEYDVNKSDQLHNMYQLNEHIILFSGMSVDVLLQDILIKDSCARVFTTMKIAKMEDGSSVDLIGIETIMLKRKLLGWRIDHIHWLYQKIGRELLH